MPVSQFPLRNALLEHKRRQQEDGYEFPLTATFLGQDDIPKARVRRLNLTDRAAIDQLPAELQSTVWEGVKEFEKLQKANKAGKADPESLIEAVTNNEKSLKASDAFCLAAFLNPRLVATEAELASNPDAYVVGDLAAEDRIGVFMMCVDADSASARNLKLFRPERPADAATRPTGAVAPTAIGDHEPAVAGV